MKFRICSFALLFALLLTVCASPETAPAFRSPAHQLLNEGHVDELVTAMNARLNTNPRDAEAANLMGRAYYSAGRWDEAIAAHERAVSMVGNNSNYQMWLARAYGEKADASSFVSALDFARKFRSTMELAVQLDPNNVDARSDLAEFYVQAPGMVGGGRDKAAAQADAITRLDPGIAAYIRALLAEKDKNYGEAEAQLKNAIPVAKHPGRAWLNLASFYRRRNRPDDVQATVRQAVASSKDNGVLLDASELLVRVGRDFGGAADYLREYINKGPHTEDAPVFHAHYVLGSIFEKQGDKRAAGDEYRAALALARDYGKAKAGLKRVQ
jgi:tetratricopeptide (TPR) repeat protein